MLAHRLQHWPNIEPAFAQHLVSAEDVAEQHDKTRYIMLLLV